MLGWLIVILIVLVPVAILAAGRISEMRKDERSRKKF